MKSIKIKKESENNMNKWKGIPYSWIGRIGIVKMSILPKHLQTQCNSYQIPVAFFYRTRTNNSKI